MRDVIQTENLCKEYILGNISHGSLSRDLQAWWSRIRKKEDPNSRMNFGSRLHRDSFLALNDVSFQVRQGEIVGVIGRNGAGKSTLLKILSRITAPTLGQVKIKGRVASLLEIGTGFHADLSGRENIFLNGAILGMTKADIKRRFDEIVDFAEIDSFIDTPVKRYSSGMYIRLAFAVASFLEADILLVDEVLAVGDTKFQKKCLGRLNESKDSGKTIIFVSHNMDAIRNICSRVILLRDGKIHYDGNVDQGISKYFEFIGEVNETTSLHDATYRRGNGSLRMSKFFLQQNHMVGADLQHITNQDPLKIEIEYVTFAATRGIGYAVYLKAKEAGNYIVRINGIATQEEIPANSRGKITVTLDKLDLPAGIYPVYLNLTDKESYLSDIPVIYDVLDELLPPIIIESDRHKSEGFLRLNYSSTHEIKRAASTEYT